MNNNYATDFCTENVDKDVLFNMLVDSINNCKLCPDMECRTKVFSEYNGNIYSNVLFIAEAPGRLGADKTRIPLFGDKTGLNFQRLIDNIGWSRDSFFITNAVLCNPRDERGNNTAPSKTHIRNCSVYLQLLIKIMRPEYIITLGTKALEALSLIHKIDISLKKDVRKIFNWNGYNLIPLYHTGPRAMIHRNFYNQLADFYWIQRHIQIKATPWSKVEKSELKKKIQKVRASQTKMQKLIMYILSNIGSAGEFKIAKLLFLIDYYSLKNRRKLVTDAFYIRSYDGPIPIGLDKQLKELCDMYIIKKIHGKYYLNNIEIVSFFNEEEQSIINKVINIHGKKTNSQIKTAAYLTKPMKRILRIEKYENQKMLHVPVFSEQDFR